jgi:hypothetical protein
LGTWLRSSGICLWTSSLLSSSCLWTYTRKNRHSITYLALKYKVWSC